MTKSELKSTALDSMSQAGGAMQEGNFKEAKELAQKAWNCYFELQKQRSEDEDFTDLIYYARDLYNRAKEALEQQEQEIKQVNKENCQDQEDEVDYTHYEFTIEDLEEDLQLMLSRQKEAKEKENNNGETDSYPVFLATYNLLIDQVLVAEKRAVRQRDCWKNIQLVKDFTPGVKYMLQSQHLDKQAHENMLDLSLRAFESIDNTLCSTSPLSSIRLKRELEQLIIDIAKGLPDQEKDLEQYEDVLTTLDFFISKADNEQLEQVNTEFYGMVYDPIELTAQYETFLPEADHRGEEVYRMKGEQATVQDFYKGKRLYLAAMGVNWTPPREAEVNS